MKDVDFIGWVLLILFFVAFGVYNFHEYTFLKEIRDGIVETNYILKEQMNDKYQQ